MLNKIIHLAIKNKLLVLFFTISLLIVGVYEASKLPIDAVPDITNNQVQIITTAPSYGALDIERMITFPVEKSIQSIKGIEQIRSFSRFGLSLVTVIFKESVDIYWARQQISERLQYLQNEIPKEVGLPELAPISTGLGEVYQYVVRAKEAYKNKYSLSDLRTIQDWIIRRHLLGVEGVAEVSSFGGKLKQYEVAMNLAKLHALGLTIEDVVQALEKNNTNTGGAYIEKNDQAIFVRSEGLLATKQDIEQIFVKHTANRHPMLIKDVAKVTEGYATRYGALCFNNEGEVAGAVILMLKGANSNEVIQRIKQRVEEIRHLLPEGIIIQPFIDRTKIIHNAISTVAYNLAEGALIVIFVVILFLGQIRGGLIVASVIPLSLLFAIVMMNLFGVSGNLMSLGAIDFGLIVDGAVIIVEAVLHQIRKQNPRASSPLSPAVAEKEVETAASKMMNSAVVGQLIILVVYLPIFTLEGIEGKMFVPMAQTVCFALLGAFLLSISYVPMMSAMFLARKGQRSFSFSEKLFQALSAHYERLLRLALRFSTSVVLMTIILFGLAVWGGMSLGGEFLPTLEEGDFAIESKVIPGSNLQTTIHYTQKVSKVLLDHFPEIETVVSKIGSSEVPTDPMPIENADLIVTLKPKSEWTSAQTFTEMEEQMRKVIAHIPGIKVGFQFPIQMRFNELMSGARQDVICKIFGEDLPTLVALSTHIGKLVSNVEGVQDVYVEPISGSPQIIVRYDRKALASYGLNVNDVNHLLNTAFAGRSCGIIFEGEKRFELVARLESDQRHDIEQIKNLLIPTAIGTKISLQTVASVTQENSPNQVQREDAKRRAIVGFNVKDKDIQSVVEEIKKRLNRDVHLPAGYLVKFGGNFENLERAMQRLYVVVPIALILIFLILLLNFKSLKTCFLIYSAIPLSSMGGIFLLLLRGMPFSVSAGIGFIALFGVAVLNSIVLIAEFNALKKRGLNHAEDIVVQGSKERLRPVLMTAMVASLGFLPMAVSNGAGAEVQRPLATVVIGGLLFATLLTLVVLPILYAKLQKSSLAKRLPLSVLAFIFLIGTKETLAAQPQTPPNLLSLSAAMDSAIKNNALLKSYQLQSQQHRTLQGTAFSLSPTQITFEDGHLNSALYDNRLSIAQAFSFPTVYTSKAKALRTTSERYAFLASKKEAELIKDVSVSFYRLLSLRERIQALKNADSLMATLLQHLSLKQKLGEIDMLEKSYFSLQKMNIRHQLNDVEIEQHAQQRTFQKLVGISHFYDLEALPLKAPWTHSALPTLSAHSISSQLLQHPLKEAQANLSVKVSELMPSLNVAYINQTFAGLGADDKQYTLSSRFNAFQIGIGIPLFFNGSLAKIKSAKIGKMIASLDQAYATQQLENDILNAWETCQKQSQFLAQEAASYAQDLQNLWKIALVQYRKGNITYLELCQHLFLSLDGQQQYLNAVQQYNENIFRLNFLLH